jgi:hypothetical protein
MRLGELLLAECLVSRQGLDKALVRQEASGGRLGTNLVELGLLTEQDLSRALARQREFVVPTVDRDQWAQPLLDFAVARWKRVLLLEVRDDVVTGWKGEGEGIRAAAVERINVALRGQSTFKLVRDTWSHFAGPMKRDAGTEVFFRLLGGDAPTTSVLVPLRIRGAVTHMLYVDNGPCQVTPPDIGELLILSQSVARSWAGSAN